MKRYCAHPACSKKIDNHYSYCPRHTPEAGGHVSRALRGDHPWSFFYQTLDWERTKIIVRTRDGYRCTWVEDGERCQRRGAVPGQKRRSGERLYVHHEWPLRVIWQACNGDREKFIRIACDQSRLTTYCARHHRLADFNTKGLNEEAIVKRLARA